MLDRFAKLRLLLQQFSRLGLGLSEIAVEERLQAGMRRIVHEQKAIPVAGSAKSFDPICQLSLEIITYLTRQPGDSW